MSLWTLQRHCSLPACQGTEWLLFVVQVILDLEEERQRHAQDTAEGDDVTYMLEKERERLTQQVQPAGSPAGMGWNSSRSLPLPGTPSSYHLGMKSSLKFLGVFW